MQITDLAYIDETGFHFADYPSYLQYFQDKYRGIYGADVDLGPDTQDGQFLAVLAKGAYDTAALDAATFNSYSPVTAQGAGLSRGVKINGLSRRIPTHSTADVTIVGQANTTITTGIVIDTLQQKWNLPASVTIPDSGTIIVTATAQEEGAITADTNTINRIFTPTLGWQTVNNASAATPGVAVEADAQLRVRQGLSTANPSLTVLDGTIGGVANVSGVTKVRGYENDTGSTDGDGIPAHTVSLVVKGGDAMDIANEIALHKTPGTATYGTTSELVYDAHGMPLTINFYRPTEVTITAVITIATNPAWSSDYEDLIKQAVADLINSNQIGDPVLITKLYLPAYLNGTVASGSYDIITLLIGKDLDPPDDVNIDLAFNEDAQCDPDVDIEIVVT